MINKTILRNFASLGAMQAINYILPIILTPFLVMTIGISNVGIIATMTAISAYFQLVIDYGFNLTATRDIAKNSADHNMVSRITSAVFSIKVLFSFIILLLCLASSLLFDFINGYFLTFIFTVLLTIMQSFFPVWHFQGMQKMQFITFCNALPKILCAIAILLAIKNESDVWKVQLIYFIGAACSFIMAFIALKFKFKFRFVFRFDDIKLCLIDGLSVFTARLASGLYKNFNVLILGYFSTPAAVGVYSIAEKVLRSLQMVQNVAGDTLYPIFSKNVQSKSDFFKMMTKRYAKYIILLYLLSAVVIYSASPFVSHFLARTTEHELTQSLQIMSLAFFFGGMNYIFAILGLMTSGYNKEFSICVIYTGLFNMIVATALSFKYSYLGGAFALVLSEVFLFILVFYYSKKSGVI